jgi:uncharacterized membrane protein YkvA (DUF1232 family)
MPLLTRTEILAALGSVDDIVVAEIIVMGATAEELAQARAWATDDLIVASKPLPSDRVGQLIQILEKVEDDAEALLGSKG